jgi:hypothetical protein
MLLYHKLAVSTNLLRKEESIMRAARKLGSTRRSNVSLLFSRYWVRHC